jgi:dachs protein
LRFFSEDGSGAAVFLHKGETVIVIGASPRRGHLVVEKRNHTVHVPFHCLELKQPLTGLGH